MAFGVFYAFDCKNYYFYTVVFLGFDGRSSLEAGVKFSFFRDIYVFFLSLGSRGSFEFL